MDFGANRVSDRAPKKGEYRCSSVDGLSEVSNAQLIEAQLKNIHQIQIEWTKIIHEHSLKRTISEIDMNACNS